MLSWDESGNARSSKTWSKLSSMLAYGMQYNQQNDLRYGSK